MTFKSDVALRMKKWISQVFSVGLFVEYVGDSLINVSITGWQWTVAELLVRVDAVVMPNVIFLSIDLVH